jgi:VWFA-related protein
MESATLTEFLPALALAIALAASAGLRAWLPLLLAGSLARWGVLDLGPSFQFLASNKALVVFAVATVVEIAGDKFPAIDHALDAIGTPLRPAAGALLAASVLGTVSDPLTAIVLGTAVGAPSALVPHAAKSALRAVSSAATGGIANPFLSLLEDVISVLTFVAAVLVPLLGRHRRYRQPVPEPARGRDLRAHVRRRGAGAAARRLHARPDALAGLALAAPPPRGGADRMSRALAALLCLSAATRAAAQTPPAQPPARPPLTIESAVEVVSVTALVFDKSGKVIHGLGPGDVELLEDGVPQEVSYFREASGGGDPQERVPLSVALALDTSGSMKQSLAFLQEAVLGFVYKLDDVDRTLVINFNESVKGSAEFTDDQDRVERFVEGLQAWGGTSLYDAIHYALDRVKDQPGRKAVIVFSDGADTTSTTNGDSAIEHARAVEATVYCIGFDGAGPGGSPRGFLRKIAGETGGELFTPDKVGDLIKVFNVISNELKNHYLLAYTPKRAADGTWRRISLRVNRPGAEVRVRKGYFAVARRRKAD